MHAVATLLCWTEQEILKQKSACARIIASKDSLIKEFQAELKAKDEECVALVVLVSLALRLLLPVASTWCSRCACRPITLPQVC